MSPIVAFARILAQSSRRDVQHRRRHNRVREDTINDTTPPVTRHGTAQEDIGSAEDTATADPNPN